MKENAIRKINIFGKVTSIIAKVCKILCFVAAGAILIGIIATAIVPNDIAKITVKGNAKFELNLASYGIIPEETRDEIVNQITGGSANVNGADVADISAEVDETTINVEATSLSYTYRLHDLIPLMVTGLLSVLVMISTLIFLEQLCKAIKTCESPFEENVIKKMRNFAFAMIPWAVIDSINSIIVASAFRQDVNVVMKINPWMVMVVLIILGLTYIFKYGAVLQKESDETL